MRNPKVASNEPLFNHIVSKFHGCPPTKINDKILSQVLNHIRVSEHLRYIEVRNFRLRTLGNFFWSKDPKQSLQVEELSIENENLAVLSWQTGLPCPDPHDENLGRNGGKSVVFT